MAPLKKPSPVTVGVGFVLGVVQSATSVPFFAGIAVISAGDFTVATRYLSMIAYASVALSLPFLTALAIGYIRSHPYSRIGRGFATVQDNREAAARSAATSSPIASASACCSCKRRSAGPERPSAVNRSMRFVPWPSRW